MTADQWQQLKDILAGALECNSDAERLEFVTVSCRNDANLKAELDALLAQEDHAWLDESFLLELRASLLRTFAPNEVAQINTDETRIDCFLNP